MLGQSVEAFFADSEDVVNELDHSNPPVLTPAKKRKRDDIIIAMKDRLWIKMRKTTEIMQFHGLL